MIFSNRRRLTIRVPLFRVVPELRFAQINWHAVGFRDKLRFEEEVDRACAVRNGEVRGLRERIKWLEVRVRMLENRGGEGNRNHERDSGYGSGPGSEDEQLCAWSVGV